MNTITAFPSAMLTNKVADEIIDSVACTDEFITYFNRIPFTTYATINLRQEGNVLKFISLSLTFEDTPEGEQPACVCNGHGNMYQSYMKHAKEIAYGYAEKEMRRIINELGI